MAWAGGNKKKGEPCICVAKRRLTERNFISNAFNTTRSFVLANWPETCIDDEAFYNDTTSGCVELDYPPPVDRAQAAVTDKSGGVKTQRSEMAPYYSNNDTNRYFVGQGQPSSYYGIWDNATARIEYIIEHAIENHMADSGLLVSIPNLLVDGYLIAPKAATGPRQYARKINVRDIVPSKYLAYEMDGRIIDMANITAGGEIWERCTTAKGVPTTGGDGLFGRSIGPVEVPQPRRQAFGWDGCREEDMAHGAELWTYPSSRSDHTGFFYPEDGLLLFYGGVGYGTGGTYVPQDPSLEMTHETTVLNDFWAYNINKCNNDCNNQGECRYGFCICDSGFYGLDCSNMTCPGDFCYYDEVTNEQVCNHCCYAGYTHTDEDVYVPDTKKVFCSKEETGHSNGICDG